MSSHRSTAASVGPQGSGARRRLSRARVLMLMGLIGAVLAVIDQISKNWAEANLPLLEPQPLIGELLQLTLLYNTGAAWGMGAEITPVVTILQILIVLGVIIFAVTSVRSLWYTVALGLILGGALGNIYDRLLREPGPFRGAVVDFLELPNWPVFNVADMAVVGGAILVVALGLFGVAADPARAEAEEPAEREARRSDEAAQEQDPTRDEGEERADRTLRDAGPVDAEPTSARREGES